MAEVLSSSSRLPLYYQLKLELLNEIGEGKYPEGSTIPSEKQLGVIYSVSRTTVRKAIDELESEGHLSRIQGRGTFVTRPFVDRYPTLASFSERLDANERLPEHKTLEIEFVEAPPEIQAELETQENPLSIHLRRLLLIDGTPVGYAEIWIPEDIVKDHVDLFSPEHLDPHSIYRTLEGPRINLELTKAVEIATAEAADKKLSEILDLPIGSPVLLLRHISYSKGGRPIEALRLAFGGKHYHYRTELFRPSGSGWAGRVFIVDD